MTVIGRDILQLQTPRLLLRPVEAGDAAATAALITPDVAANLSTWPSPMSTVQAADKIGRSRAMLGAREAVDLAIVDRNDGALLGWIGLALVAPATARLGYWLGTAARGRGLMKEAVAMAVPPAAAFVDAGRIVAMVLKDNAPSIAVLRATGFEFTGEELVPFEVARVSRPCFRFERSAR